MSLYLAILRQARPGDLASRMAVQPSRPADQDRAACRARPAPPRHPGAGLGRDRELAQLTTAWQKAAAGEPGVVLVVGEAWIGKTRLAEALAAEAASAGATVLPSRCYETERSLFLQPVVEAVLPLITAMPGAELRQLLGGDAPPFAAVVPEVAALLGPMPSERVAVDMQRRRAFHSAPAFLRELAARNPVLLMPGRPSVCRPVRPSKSRTTWAGTRMGPGCR